MERNNSNANALFHNWCKRHLVNLHGLMYCRPEAIARQTIDGVAIVRRVVRCHRHNMVLHVSPIPTNPQASERRVQVIVAAWDESYLSMKFPPPP